MNTLHSRVRPALAQPTTFWRGIGSLGATLPHHATGLAKVEEAIVSLSDARRSLGKRSGARQDAARAWLDEQHTKLTRALAAFESVGPACTGPAAVAVAERIDAAAVSVARAQAAHAAARDSAAMAAARDAIDLARAESRDAEQALSDLIDSLAAPAFDWIDVIAQAKADTLALLDMARSPHTARALEEALRQGGEYDRAIMSGAADPTRRAKLKATLYAAFESKDDPADVFAWRAKRLAESGYVAPKPAPAPVKPAGFRADMASITRVALTGNDGDDFREIWSRVHTGNPGIRRDLYEIVGGRWPDHFDVSEALTLFSKAWSADREGRTFRVPPRAEHSWMI